jgi:hypothetical protein
MNPCLSIARVNGDPAELADAYTCSAETMAAVGRDHGLLVHAAARSDDGLILVNLWPSPAGSESAAQDPRRLEVLRGLDLPPGAFQREHHDVVNYDLFGPVNR